MTNVKEIVTQVDEFSEYYKKSDRKPLILFCLIIAICAGAFYMFSKTSDQMTQLEDLILILAQEQENFYMVVGEFEKTIARSGGSNKKEIIDIKRKYQGLMKQNRQLKRKRRSIKGGGGKIYKMQMPKGYMSEKNAVVDARELRRNSIGADDNYIYVTDDDFELTEVMEKDREYQQVNELVGDKQKPSVQLESLIEFIKQQTLGYDESQWDDRLRPRTSPPPLGKRK